jgi:hypothetical protein
MTNATAGSRWQPFAVDDRAMLAASEALVGRDTVDDLAEQPG